MDGHELFFRKSKTKLHRILLKKKMQLLKHPHKYTKKFILLTAHKKQQLLWLQKRKKKKTYFAVL